MWTWVKRLFLVAFGVVCVLVLQWQVVALYGGFCAILYLTLIRPRLRWKHDFDGLPDHVRQRYLEYERARSRHVSAQDWTRVGAAIGQASRDSARAARAARRDD